MVLIGSDVPLEEDILKKPVEFVNSWVEWSAQNREQILRQNAATSGTATIFTVPAENTLWITSIQLSGTKTGITGTFSTLEIENRTTLASLTFVNAGDNNSTTISFPMPIKVEGGERIVVQGQTNCFARGIITGWIEPKRIN